MQTNPAMMDNALDAINQQITSDQFPEARSALARLIRSGFEVIEARRLMAQIFMHELFMVKNHRQPFDRRRYGAMLMQLPKLPINASCSENK
ncbi:hypothetical protein Mmc1_2779 [Magnetococcus marinus MC-1]|uniref:Uncharacterized protein n=1 Tax=Magnetococcus marinus (strain ATCC BAA-1437 / JCM 17883 / MC-1) TaxID=156889 RepID=A0LBC9_MAGMM|nr:hypothetical protein [Magnetococcus marinus]ABK45272.1 hypothetical protein Mmc1_2779 [Magnetococcus marinus MC-1]